jgi:hypothetical protein
MAVLSDRRFKTAIESIESTGLIRIKCLRPVYYRYVFDEPERDRRVGFIAQEVLKIVPEAVDVMADEEQSMSLRPQEIIPFLVKAVQELSTKVEQLESILSSCTQQKVSQ